MGDSPLSAPVVGLEATPDGGGYWEVAADGGVFAFGDAGYYGSAAGESPGSSIVGLAPTADGKGYWELAADGSVFAFGDAAYAGNAPVTQPAVGITRDGPGYLVDDAGGGVFAMGGATFRGSMGGASLNQPLTGVVGEQNGYLALAADGGLFAFGTAIYYGSLGGSTIYVPPPPPQPAVANYGITPLQQAEWDRVNMCEEGGVWNVDGPVYSGGLGFSHANWNQFNTFGFPSDAADATPAQQIRVAVAFAEYYWGSPNAAPDQNGCAGY